MVFKAEPEEAGLEDVPLVPPEPGDEPPHPAASNAAPTNTTAQAICSARGKNAGYVVDYYGVAENLKVALAAYAAEDVEGR